MRKQLVSAAALLLFAATAAAVEAEDAAGVWQTASGGYVEVYSSGDVWQGKIVGSKSGEPRKDENNPDESKRDRQLLGVTVLEGLEYVGDGEFENGQIYDPNNGKTYKARASIEGPDALEVRGFVGISMLGRSQNWSRIDPTAKNVHQDLLEGDYAASE